jgi:uncharacterized membrane protein YdfJ with MMPL/SSD domain
MAAKADPGHDSPVRLSLSGIFPRLAHVTLRRPWAVIGAWLFLVAVPPVAFQPVTKMAGDRGEEVLPSDAAVTAATRQMTKAFREPGVENVALVVLTDEHGMTAADEDVLLLDTFVVRTITVPAMAVPIGKANWWPSGWRPKRRPSSKPISTPAAVSEGAPWLWMPRGSKWLRQS